MDISHILNIVLGGGVLALLINRWFDRKKDQAAAAEAGENARGKKLENDAKEVAQILGYTQSLNDLAKKLADNDREIQSLNRRVSEIERERDDLKSELKAKDAVIDYQKDERHAWTETLLGVQEKYAESKLKIKTLEERITILEHHSEELTKLELREPK
jgi:predicted RNase H-like nuclease (RuvC/YqgF family)